MAEKLSVSAQRAAIAVLEAEGMTLDVIHKKHKELRDGVAALQKERQEPPARAGHGPRTMPERSVTRI